MIEHYTDIQVVGSLHSAPELEIDERHLGLMPSNESSEAAAKIRLLGQRVAEQVDLDRIIASAADNVPLPERVESKPLFSGDRVRIGYPRDRAFGFYYPGDLERLEAAGAELVPFDTLVDTTLPTVDGLFIGGGFPEIAMDELEQNSSLRHQIKDFIESGGPVYAECGGLMYLARNLTWGDKMCSMVGAIPGDIVMHDRPQGRGYVRLRERDECPWPKLPGQSEEIAAHEFHYSALENLDKEVRFAYQVLRGAGIDGTNDGVVYKNLLASYTHMRDVGGNHWTRRFVKHVRTCKQQVI